MAIDIKTTEGSTSTSTAVEQHFYRFHVPHLHLQSVFGDDWFALKAEAFARFFGTPRFLIAQTAVVGVWILVNGEVLMENGKHTGALPGRVLRNSYYHANRG